MLQPFFAKLLVLNIGLPTKRSAHVVCVRSCLIQFNAFIIVARVAKVSATSARRRNAMFHHVGGIIQYASVRPVKAVIRVCDYIEACSIELLSEAISSSDHQDL